MERPYVLINNYCGTPDDHMFEIKYPAAWKNEITEVSGDVIHHVRFYNEGLKGNFIEVKLYERTHGLEMMARGGMTENNLFTIKPRYAYNFTLTLNEGDKLTQEMRDLYEDVFGEMLGQFEELKVEEASECIVTGCSNQLCSDKVIDTTCEYSPAYDCYQTAECKRQDSGACGWTITDELKSCLKNAVGVEK